MVQNRIFEVVYYISQSASVICIWESYKLIGTLVSTVARSCHFFVELVCMLGCLETLTYPRLFDHECVSCDGPVCPWC